GTRLLSPLATGRKARSYRRARGVRAAPPERPRSIRFGETVTMIAGARFALVCLAAWATGCASDPNDPETWLQRLKDARQRRVAVHQLVRIGDPRAGPALVSLYEKTGSFDSDLLDAIIHFHDWRAIPILIGQLPHAAQNAASVEKAAAELGRLHAREAVTPLLALLQKPPSARVQRAGVLALGEIGDPVAVEPLCALLRQKVGYDLPLSAASARALGQIGHARG